MLCNKCQIEVEPLVDQWNKVRCPKCKQMLSAPANSTKVAGDPGSSKTVIKSESNSPGYTEYLRKSAKYQDSKLKFWGRLFAKIRSY